MSIFGERIPCPHCHRLISPRAKECVFCLRNLGGAAVATGVVGVITAITLWSIIHGHGVRLAAEGQHLLASLDLAVHTSPFLPDADRISAMNLASSPGT